MFEFIAHKKGKITAFELSNALNIPLNQATRILTKMCNDGFATTCITDQGNSLYCVRGVVSEEERSVVKNH